MRRMANITHTEAELPQAPAFEAAREHEELIGPSSEEMARSRAATSVPATFHSVSRLNPGLEPFIFLGF